MFTISTFFVAAYASIFFEEIRTVLIDDIDEPVANKIISYQERFTYLSLLQQVMFFVEASGFHCGETRMVYIDTIVTGCYWRFRGSVESLGVTVRKQEDRYSAGSVTLRISRCVV